MVYDIQYAIIVDVAVEDTALYMNEMFSAWLSEQNTAFSFCLILKD